MISYLPDMFWIVWWYPTPHSSDGSRAKKLYTNSLVDLAWEHKQQIGWGEPHPIHLI